MPFYLGGRHTTIADNNSARWRQVWESNPLRSFCRRLTGRSSYKPQAEDVRLELTHRETPVDSFPSYCADLLRQPSVLLGASKGICTPNAWFVAKRDVCFTIDARGTDGWSRTTATCLEDRCLVCSTTPAYRGPIGSRTRIDSLGNCSPVH